MGSGVMVVKRFFIDKTVLIILLCYSVAWLILDVGGGDVYFASKLYFLQGQQWLLREHWLMEEVLHTGARKLVTFCVLGLILITLYVSFYAKSHRVLAKALFALSISVIFSLVIVAYFKSITNVACPWSLSLFGGSEPYYHLLEPRPSFLPYHRCFPAGHASAGYAWVALYYFLACLVPKWRFLGLGFGIFFGGLLGFVQQIRGAHFLSHDITTLVLSLLIAKLCFMLLYKEFDQPIVKVKR